MKIFWLLLLFISFTCCDVDASDDPYSEYLYQPKAMYPNFYINFLHRPVEFQPQDYKEVEAYFKRVNDQQIRKTVYCLPDCFQDGTVEALTRLTFDRHEPIPFPPGYRLKLYKRYYINFPTSLDFITHKLELKNCLYDNMFNPYHVSITHAEYVISDVAKFLTNKIKDGNFDGCPYGLQINVVITGSAFMLDYHKL